MPSRQPGETFQNFSPPEPSARISSESHLSECNSQLFSVSFTVFMLALQPVQEYEFEEGLFRLEECKLLSFAGELCNPPGSY